MKLLTQIKSLRHLLWQGFWRLMPIQSNKVILWADNFKSFGCSPKYIALELVRQGGWDVVWVLDRERPVPSDMPPEIRVVPYFSMQYLREIATAKFVVCNHRTSNYHFFRKRPGQFYIQTWHSSLRLKRIEGDAELPESYVETAKQDSAKIDLLLSGCRFSTEIFRRAFWYDGEILEKGTPRCDGFFGDNFGVKEKVFRHFGIPAGKKLALYAPTFRNDKKPSLYGMDPERLRTALGQDWVVGCRMHPNLNGTVDMGPAISMSGYPDMQELLAACDLLITDYSSSMFDMAVAGKKCVLYVPDLNSYLARERGLYFDLRELPFPKAETMEDLCEIVSRWPDGEDAEWVQAFLHRIGNYETGNAAKSVVKWISEKS